MTVGLDHRPRILLLDAARHRSHLFEICRKHLTPNGVAFVSYNVLPGWQSRLALCRWLLQMIDRGRNTAERFLAFTHHVFEPVYILAFCIRRKITDSHTQLRSEVMQLEQVERCLSTA